MLILVAPGPVAFAQADPVAANQQGVAANLQKRLPARFDEFTELTSVIAVGRQLKYSFRLLVPKTKIPARWYLVQKQHWFDQACGRPQVRKLLKDGASYSYQYTDVNNRYVTEIKVRDRDC